MKSYILLPFVLLIGLLVGGWGVRADLREARADLKEARRQAKKGGSAGRSVQIGQGVTSLLNINNSPVEDKKPKKKKAVQSSVDKKDSKVKVSLKVGDEKEGDKAIQTDEERQAGLEENINRAVELWEVRSRLARATFVDRAELNDEQAERFDVLVDAMNVRLAGKIEDWVKNVERKEDVGSEDGVRLVNGLTEVMVSAYDDLDRDMPEGWREKNDSEMNITDFIDPGVAVPLVRIQDRMSGKGGGKGSRRGDIVF